MTVKLFESYQLGQLELKNRIAMSPMCMYSAGNDGLVSAWHATHYESRAVGQVGLVILEATAVLAEGRISEHDLGIWSDVHIEGLRDLAHRIKKHGAKAAIQLGHAGRKADLASEIFAPSPVAFSDYYQQPTEMTQAKILELIEAFKEAAHRADQADFDVVEIHAAHGYLLNQFLSPLANQRKDEYGGSAENRYRLLREVIQAVRLVWHKPLLVRISANDFTQGGMTPADYIPMAQWMKEQGVDLIDVSSGAVVPAQIDAFASYQVPYAQKIRQEAKVPTSAVGLITEAVQAEEIVHNDRADLVMLGRELLRDPYWPIHAAKKLEVEIPVPKQYLRA